jgi:hypothetical protein
MRAGMECPSRFWEDITMRFSSLFVTSPAVAILSIELLCGVSGAALSQTTPGPASSLPSVMVEAPKQVARPKHHSTVAHSTVSRPTSPPTHTSQASQTPLLSESVTAKLAKLEKATGSCAGGCQTSFRYGNDPWHGCSGSSGMYSSTCRNVGNYKTYAECTAAGLITGWRNNDISWYCTSLALK